jgi:hypothetical protein
MKINLKLLIYKFEIVLKIKTSVNDLEIENLF